MRHALFVTLLLTGSPAPGLAQDVRAALDADSMYWDNGESVGRSEKNAVLDSLGLRVDPQRRPASGFHLIDLTGDGSPEVVYSGWNADFDSAGTLRTGEGRLLQIYQVDDGKPVLVYRTNGRISRVWRQDSAAATRLRIRHDGCCGDDRIFTEDLSPEVSGGRLSYRTVQVLLTPIAVVRPEQLLRSRKMFVVQNDVHELRASPEIDDRPAESQWGVVRGNVLAEYGRSAEGIALGESIDDSGSVWWFVVMNPATPPRSAVHRDDTMNGRPAAARAGWMSNRFVRVTAEGAIAFR